MFGFLVPHLKHDDFDPNTLNSHLLQNQSGRLDDEDIVDILCDSGIPMVIHGGTSGGARYASISGAEGVAFLGLEHFMHACRDAKLETPQHIQSPSLASGLGFH